MNTHLQNDLLNANNPVTVQTLHGPITGGRAGNGILAFLEVPYALPPKRFQDPQKLPPDFCYDQTHEYIYETSYAAQPMNDGQAAGSPIQDKLGLGSPTENPLFLNIVCPPSSPSPYRFPVKVYIHGGFLQFGSPHGLTAKAIHICAERSEVWVNVGYRLSAFGFLACDKPFVSGNFGFKDQWLALEWIVDNIAAFGGDRHNVQITGLSAGAHSVHQMLHHASRLPAGEKSPFQSAVLQSNAILTNPKTQYALRPQFFALCRALDINPEAPDALSILSDPSQVTAADITRVIETDAVGTQYGTFRGCTDDVWLGSPDAMTWQRTGGFARGLTSAGVRSIAVGDLCEEWYLYSIAHPISRISDIKPNLTRYFSEEVVDRLVSRYDQLPENASAEKAQRLFGHVLSDAQVHLPARILARDLLSTGFPMLRYEIRWTPEQVRPQGYVTHGTDRSLWLYQLQLLQEDQPQIALAWLNAFDDALHKLEASDRKSKQDLGVVLTLKEDKTISWTEDVKLARVLRLRDCLPGEIE